MENSKRFATSTEVAKMFGVGPVAAWRMMHAGRIPCIEIGRRLYADLSLLGDTIEAQTERRESAKNPRR